MEGKEPNWPGIRAEYVAGGVTLAELAKKHGVNDGAVRRRSKEEGWVAARRQARAQDIAPADDADREATDTAPADGDDREAEDTASADGAERKAEDTAPADGADREAGDGAEDARIALRLRKQLLMKLQRAAEAMPLDATEYKTTEDGGAVKLLKLRDLTAAYKELVGDLPAEDGDGWSRVVIDI